MVKEDTQTRSPVLYFCVFGGFSCLHMLCDLGMILTKSWHHYLRRIGKYWQEPKDKVYSFLSCGLFLSRVKWWMNLSPKIKYIHIYVYIYICYFSHNHGSGTCVYLNDNYFFTSMIMRGGCVVCRNPGWKIENHGIKILKYLTRWWCQTFFIFHPYLGKIPILSDIFQGVETTN